MNKLKTYDISEKICKKLNEVLLPLDKGEVEFFLQEDNITKWDGKLLLGYALDTT